MTAAEVVGSARELAVLPASYLRLSKVLESRGSTAEQIAEAIKLDPALSARLLRHANSAAFSPPKPVNSLAHATCMVGISTLRHLAMATSIVTMFRGVPEHLLSMSSFWTHSVAVGTTAHLLAMRARTTRPDTAFLAGLLHDVGELLICLQCPQDARKVLLETDRQGVPNTDVEIEFLGFTHADVGGLLLKHWGLSAPEIAAATFHHNPSAAPTAHRPLVDLVHIADVTVSALQIGNAGERSAHPLKAEAWARTGLRSLDMASIVSQIDRQMGNLAETIAG